MVGREILDGFISEFRLQLMDDPALGTWEFFLVCISGKSFSNEGVEYGCLGDSINDEFLELSARVVLKC